MRYLPYAVGLFMLVPFAIWLVLWAFFLPGPKHGLDVPLSAALFAPTIPLVAWFFLSNLALVSNSMAGRNEFETPTVVFVRRLISALPVAAIGLGGAGTAWLIVHNEPIYLIPLPTVVGLCLGLSIVFGERTRHEDAADKAALAVKTSVETPTSLQASVKPSQRSTIIMKVLYCVPVLGWFIRDAVEGRPSARAYFTANLVMVWIIAAVWVGYPLVLVTMLFMVAAAFSLLMLAVRA